MIVALSIMRCGRVEFNVAADLTMICMSEWTHSHGIILISSSVLPSRNSFYANFLYILRMALLGLREDQQNNHIATGDPSDRSESRLSNKSNDKEQQQPQQDGNNQRTDDGDREQQSGQFEACVSLIVTLDSDLLSYLCFSC